MPLIDNPIHHAKLANALVTHIIWWHPHVYIAFIGSVSRVLMLLRPNNHVIDARPDTFHNFTFPATIYTIYDVVNAVAAHSPDAVCPLLMYELNDHLAMSSSSDPTSVTYIGGLMHLMYSSQLDAYIIPVHPSHTPTDTPALIIPCNAVLPSYGTLRDAVIAVAETFTDLTIPTSTGIKATKPDYTANQFNITITTCNRLWPDALKDHQIQLAVCISQHIRATTIMRVPVPYTPYHSQNHTSIRCIANTIAQQSDILLHAPAYTTQTAQDPYTFVEYAHVLARPTTSHSLYIDANTIFSCHVDKSTPFVTRTIFHDNAAHLAHISRLPYRDQQTVLRLIIDHAVVIVRPILTIGPASPYANFLPTFTLDDVNEPNFVSRITALYSTIDTNIFHITQTYSNLGRMPITFIDNATVLADHLCAVHIKVIPTFIRQLLQPISLSTPIIVIQPPTDAIDATIRRITNLDSHEHIIAIKPSTHYPLVHTIVQTTTRLSLSACIAWTKHLRAHVHASAISIHDAVAVLYAASLAVTINPTIHKSIVSVDAFAAYVYTTYIKQHNPTAEKAVITYLTSVPHLQQAYKR
jgi:hypothetical protein